MLRRLLADHVSTHKVAIKKAERIALGIGRDKGKGGYGLLGSNGAA